MKRLACLLLTSLLGLSCQPGNRESERSPDTETRMDDSLRKDRVPNDTTVSKDSLKTTDSLQSPSFP